MQNQSVSKLIEASVKKPSVQENTVPENYNQENDNSSGLPSTEEDQQKDNTELSPADVYLEVENPKVC